MRTAFISLSFLLAGSLMVPAIAHTPASKKKVATTTQKGKILPMKEYIDQLMAKMTLQEKIGQLNLMVAGDITTGGALDTQVGGDIAKGNMGGVFNIKGLDKIKALQDIAIKNSRLGIPLLVGMDVIHGYETMFPIPLALSCSWDTEAMKKVGEVSAKEASAAGINWTYSPMVDIALDARWGRISEGNGEDPYLSGVMGAALTQGYQGADMRTEEILRADRIMACLKHFALYGAVESGKEYNTVDMSRIRMMNQYLPPYEAVVKAGVGSVMSSFNLIDYTPATANHWMMTDVLRKQWGFKGFVVTDYASIAEILNHGTAKDLKEASEQALLAGTDMDMCSNAFVKHLAQSVAEGKVTEEDINTACRRILEAKYKLGLFSNPYRYCNAKRNKTDIYSAENRQIARDVAAETFVLLKNEGNLLPLKKQGKIALIGPLADTRNNIAGTWSVAQAPEKYTTIKEAMEKAGYFTTDTLAEDCDLTMRIIEAGYVIENENHAVAMTEAPENIRQFVKQRTRWCFGVMQTFWKHRRNLFRSRYKGFGLWALPNMLVFQYIIPTFSPIADVLMLAGLFSGNAWQIFIYYLIFLIVDASVSIMAFIVERESLWTLLWIIPQRFFYRWIMYYVIFKSYFKAIKGELQQWGVLKRTGNVKI